MLLKEYRILLPLTVDEYRIAQLYMILKKSQLDSRGPGSGVEIIKNEPYVDGPGGSGQYTYKIFHIANHLPSWIRSILPHSLVFEEEGWNAYPYTKTRYTTPFVERFVLEVETRYYNDGGSRHNVFGLETSELGQRNVDVMDIVRDPISVGDYSKEEDPRLFHSTATGRGPLSDDWAEQCVRDGKPIMCAYKLCRVHFKYWGMQSRIEKFIHDVALRKTMLRAHRQAWAWQDEWYGLTLADIRRLEAEAQESLNRTMAEALQTGGAVTEASVTTQDDEPPRPPPPHSRSIDSFRLAASPSGSANPSRRNSFRERMEALRSDSDNDDSESVYFDCADDDDLSMGSRTPRHPQNPLIRWSSVEMETPYERDGANGSPPLTPRLARTAAPCPTALLILVFHAGSPFDHAPASQTRTQQHADAHSTKATDLQTWRATLDTVLRAHYPDLSGRVAVQLVPCQAFAADTLSSLASLQPNGGDAEDPLSDGCCHPALVSALAALSPLYDEALRASIAKANQVYEDFISSPQGYGFDGEVFIVGDALGGLLAFDALSQPVSRPESVSRHPSTASTHSNVTETIPEEQQLDDIVLRAPPRGDTAAAQPVVFAPDGRRVSADNASSASRKVTPPPARSISAQPSPLALQPRSFSFEGASGEKATAAGKRRRLLFSVSSLFLMGAPLGPLLVLRRHHRPHIDNATSPTTAAPQCQQVYNLYYPVDPCCARLEPLLSAALCTLPPVAIPRYQKFPLGDGQSTYLMDHLKHYHQSLAGKDLQLGVGAGLEHLAMNGGKKTDEWQRKALLNRWWGAKRIDYALYCPEGLGTFPQSALPSLIQASYWESSDVMSFVLRQFVVGEAVVSSPTTVSFATGVGPTAFVPLAPIQKWRRRRTPFKIKNASSNHRANDVVVPAGEEQVVHARFMYGPLDVVALSGERVDVFAFAHAQWTHLGSADTDSHGRLTFQLPEEKRLGLGVHPLKMMVAGDHTYLDAFLAVVPRRCECVVFSIDGSFTASVSVSGKDPRLRPGAVDVVRYWQDLGYLILYITARPDMQQRQVVSWLAQHNFPHGLIFFTGGITTDPLRQKTLYLKRLVEDYALHLQVGYGSAKDVQVYAASGLSADRVFVVGKAPKKVQGQAVALPDGYSGHLVQLGMGSLQSVAVAAQSNAALGLRKGFFSLPGQFRASAASVLQRSHSFTPRSGKYKSQQSAPAGSTASTLAASAEDDHSHATRHSRALSPFRMVFHSARKS